MGVEFKAVTYQDGKGIFHLFPGLCKGCGLCIEKCPVDTIGWSDKLGVFGTPTVEPGHGKPCIACKMCQLVCPDCAIYIEKVNKEKAQ
ncbi:MAG: 2-oxoglutarate ferredoxin oxidoreductase subunit delta [Clostridia bacterium]|jgi:2-oxoglutarate ferredoxin oxidoreductase subunit delta|nr:4Fe-4S ferredoxin [Clostridiales bacterium]MDK2985795.1 2-oxoglutarate ferredoxin oxidoreductase subunit delta [Clostridia bacterium]